jgi:CSLREA domain-containing protein
MQHRHLLPSLLPLLVLAACTEQEPTAPAEPGGPAFSHTAGHKVVNSLADPGNGTCNATQCTLREAIKDPGSTEISFAPGLTGTITLARSGLGGSTLVVEKTLTITGPGTGIVIRRRGTDPAFWIFRIGTGAAVKLTNLTIRNGVGGIVNYGTLTLTNCVVAGNSGIGISNRGGTLTLTNSMVAGNSGLGIGSSLGTLALTNSAVEGNSGIGIAEYRGPATVTNTRIVGNSGGGIWAFLARFTLRNSTVADNSAAQEGGGIFNDTGTFTITKSTVAGNSATQAGGGIANRASPRLSATITLTNSTVSGNSAPSGGGISNSSGNGAAGVGLTSSTVARNSATQGGGGISTVGQYSGVGLTNSLVAQNSAPTGPDVLNADLVETPVFARFSLIGDGSGSGVSDGVDGNQVGSAGAPIDPKLGPLADNGGPTRTHALLLGSPAIDAASTPACPTTDQRGVLRPQGAACDIGSYERK